MKQILHRILGLFLWHWCGQHWMAKVDRTEFNGGEKLYRWLRDEEYGVICPLCAEIYFRKAELKQTKITAHTKAKVLAIEVARRCDKPASFKDVCRTTQ